MSLIEFLAFIASFLTFMYLMYKKAKEGMNKMEKEAEEETQEEEEEVQGYLKKMSKKPPPPPAPKHIMRSKQEFYAPHVPIEHIEYVSPLKNRDYSSEYRSPLNNAPSYEVHQTETSSKLDRILEELPSLKTMVILHEVFGPPKGFQ